MSSPAASVPPTPPVRFRLWQQFYAMSLPAVGMAAMGVWGLILAAMGLVLWSATFFPPGPRWKNFAGTCIVLGCPALCICCLLPSVSRAKPASRRNHCANNLKQIGLALHNYHDTYGAFPPACLADEQGRPMHSWRVLILPYLEEQALYQQYRFDEPCDGPNSLPLADRVPYCYRCRTQADATDPLGANYFAVVGPGTAWEAEKLTFADGTDQTILVIEDRVPGARWTEPCDLSLEEALAHLTGPDPDKQNVYDAEGDPHGHPGGRLVLLADGSTRFSSHRYTADSWRGAFLLADGRGFDDLAEAPPRPVPFWRTTEFEGWFLLARLIVFGLLLAAPLPWVWRQPPSPL